MWQKIKNYYHFVQAFLAALIFNFPSKDLVIIGVTGTDGKTTTVQMIYEILKAVGFKVSMISSVAARIGPKTFDTGFHVTTPNPWQVQKFLKKAVDLGSQYFVLEATSHGLDQNRLAFVKFKVAVITNISHEHLDYHKSWQSYAQAKAKLFKNVNFSILNADDRSFDFLKSKVDGQAITYSLNSSADFNLKNFPLNLKIVGDYNLANALAAAVATSTLGIYKSKIQKALNNFKGVLGRMEEINLGQNFKVIVDFAHTPNALERSLRTIKSQVPNPKSKLIAVFGAAGERDKTKRSLMGKTAAEGADISVLTAEDPRSEKVEDICDQIAKGLTSRGKKENKDFYQIYDRVKAIEFAVKLAQKDDIVALFGKSHEKSITYGKKEYPWDEFKVVKKAIERRLNAK
ncbi:MAG: UDP-N-acetylmuramyl-tripeptide synthetase [Candidatus Curtissbacteria bacterium GW2011_GWC2_38_9]|uniref:UDP-N-acetylmuramyl-tripeptide synthetase n=2 Tax=Candidatus Curtissiibacteriota TaxID=1752717 RepID=A0A1F5HR44_9BACT|nr:MAG: UDP-N-acetylmuramyl-tripeptide synthetase [Candidatus Curtissbacteria bacterium GW2011_GWC2_38_9]OGD90358.1 MAG: hypothetical protein A2Z54_01475 [Candidatus Curtissbacteria bacterium RIFCSPHIGHO2_02_39_8]OGE06449.1 MAG: hypothetical protein A2W70_01120 [Candidatus Curtissbacteria bacterium RIFCSPLOWO2_02_41_11]